MTARTISFRRERQDIVPPVEVIGPQDIVPVWLLLRFIEREGQVSEEELRKESVSVSLGG